MTAPTTSAPVLPVFGRFTEDGHKLMDTPAAGGVEVVRLADALAAIAASSPAAPAQPVAWRVNLNEGHGIEPSLFYFTHKPVDLRSFEHVPLYTHPAPVAQPAPVKRWPFVESPGEFTERLRVAIRQFGDLLPAVRNVLIENPAQIKQGADGPLSELTRERLPDVEASILTHEWRDSPAYGGEICASCSAVKGSARASKPCAVIASRAKPAAADAGAVELTTTRIEPPDFGERPKALTDDMSPDDLWHYACIVGYRTSLSEHDMTRRLCKSPSPIAGGGK